MFPVRRAVRLSLFVLRVASHATFFLEAQRVLLRLLRPLSRDHLCRAEARVLSQVRSPLQHLFISDGNGHRIHVIHASQTNRNAPSIVLLHGHSMSAAFWYRNIDDLVAMGYRVYAVDLLGWGRSARPLFRGRSATEAIDWFLHSLSGVIDGLHLASFTLVGHSLGAYLSMEYTKRTPHRVDQLVMVSPAASVRSIPVSRALYFSLPPQSIIRRGGLLGFLLFTFAYPRSEMYIQNRLRDYTYHLAAQFPPSGEDAIRPIIRFTGLRRAECVRPLIENLAVFHVPVQIICGQYDSSMPVEGVFQLFHRMKSEGFNVDLNVVEDSDHCPMLEKPDHFSEIMASIFKRRRSLAFESHSITAVASASP